MSRPLIDSLSHLTAPHDTSASFLQPEAQIAGALEARRHPDRYDWDGLKRRADPAHPHLIFQCTLDGWGIYAEGGAAMRVPPGHSFCAVIPSAHRYYLPRTSQEWTFVYAIIRHPYVVGRIVERRRTLPAVIATPPDSAIFARLVRLLETGRSAGRDRFSIEQATLDFLIEYERTADSTLYSQPARERLLAEVRATIVANLNKRIDVEDLAGVASMSRSHYAHHFKSVTGVPPGQYILQIRLEEATRRLSDPQLKLEAVAAETGFANANHFCKVFRRHLHISPGEYRRQMR